MPEKINSAIRAYMQPGQTFVATDRGRWLLVKGYREEHQASLSRIDRAPLVENTSVIREATQSEFYASCNLQDPPGYRTELTDAGEQTIIPGCERDDARTGAQQMSLF